LANEKHGQALSVHLSTYCDVIGWAQRKPELLGKLKAGYPRFLIPAAVIILSTRLRGIYYFQQQIRNTKLDQTRWFLFATARHASLCRDYIDSGLQTKRRRDPIEIFVVLFDDNIRPLDATRDMQKLVHHDRNSPLFAVTVPGELRPKASSFLQHTGFGISSRRAVYWQANSLTLRPPGHKPVPLQSLQSESFARLQGSQDQAQPPIENLKQEIIGPHPFLDTTMGTDSENLLYLTGMAAISELI
jgi:cystathionine gamma-synthase